MCSYMHIRSCTCSLRLAGANQYIAIQTTPATPRPTTGDPTSPALGYSPSSPMAMQVCPPTPRTFQVSDDDRPIRGQASGSVAAPTTPGILDAAAIGGGQVRNAKRGRQVVKFELKSPLPAPLEIDSETEAMCVYHAKCMHCSHCHTHLPHSGLSC